MEGAFLRGNCFQGVAYFSDFTDLSQVKDTSSLIYSANGLFCCANEHNLLRGEPLMIVGEARAKVKKKILSSHFQEKKIASTE